MDDREWKLVVMFSATICVMLMFGSTKLLGRSEDKTNTIETLNATVIELEQDNAMLELDNKILKSTVKYKNDEIATLKKSERDYQELCWQIDNYEFLLNQLLNKVDATLPIYEGGK